MTFRKNMAAASSKILSTFGETAVLDSKIDGFKEIAVIFEKENLLIDPDDGDMEFITPTATARTEDVKNVRNKDTLEIDGVTYVVKKFSDDGTGLTVLVLGEK